MSIASPTLSPVILATNHNSKNQTITSPTSIKKDFNNHHTSNGHDSLSKRNSRVIPSSDEEDDDDKPLVMKHSYIFTQFSCFLSRLKK